MLVKRESKTLPRAYVFSSVGDVSIKEFFCGQSTATFVRLDLVAPESQVGCLVLKFPAMMLFGGNRHSLRV